MSSIDPSYKLDKITTVNDFFKQFVEPLLRIKLFATQIIHQQIFHANSKILLLKKKEILSMQRVLNRACYMYNGRNKT